MEAELNNNDGRFNNVVFEGARLTVNFIIDLPYRRVEYIPLGIFTVDEPPRKLQSINLLAIDNLVKLDVECELDLVYPTSIRQIVEKCISAGGLACDDLSMFPLKQDVASKPVDSEKSITCRQMLMYCCQIIGVCCYADSNDGKLVFSFYHEPEIEHLKKFGISERDRMKSDIAEADTVISGHRFVDGDNSYPKNVDESYLIQTDNNPIFTVLQNKEAYAQALNDKLNGFAYRACTAEIIGYPFIEPLDIIPYQKDGVVYKTAVMHHRIALNRNSELESKAETVVKKGYATLSPFTPTQKHILQQIKTENTQGLTDLENALLNMNTAMSNAMGLYATIKTLDDGSKVTYQHDKPTLEESAYIIMANAAGTAWTDSGWNSGSPVWRYGVEKSGNAILKTLIANKISGDYIKGGTIEGVTGVFETGKVGGWSIDDTSLTTKNNEYRAGVNSSLGDSGLPLPAFYAGKAGVPPQSCDFRVYANGNGVFNYVGTNEISARSYVNLHSDRDISEIYFEKGSIWWPGFQSLLDRVENIEKYLSQL